MLVYWSQPGAGLPVPVTEGYSDVMHDGRVWRVYTHVSGDHALQVAHALDERREIAAQSALRTLLPLAALIPLLGVLIWYAVGRGLRPLDAMSRAVAMRRPDAMSPLAEGELAARSCSRWRRASTRCSRGSTRRSPRNADSPPMPRTSCARRSRRSLAGRARRARAGCAGARGGAGRSEGGRGPRVAAGRAAADDGAARAGGAFPEFRASAIWSRSPTMRSSPARPSPMRQASTWAARHGGGRGARRCREPRDAARQSARQRVALYARRRARRRRRGRGIRRCGAVGGRHRPGHSGGRARTRLRALPSRRAARTTRRTSTGSGLGLSIVRRIADAHGATVDARAMVRAARASSCGCVSAGRSARAADGDAARNPGASLKVRLSRPSLHCIVQARTLGPFPQESTMRLSKVTYALIAAGVGAGLATGYTHLDTLAGRRGARGNAAGGGGRAAAGPDRGRQPSGFHRARRSRRRVRRQHQHLPRRRARASGPRGPRRGQPVLRILQALRRLPNAPGMRPQQPSRGVGSGFIVSPDGYIVTNAHVVDGATEVTVKLTDRREFTAKVIGSDKRTDIALDQDRREEPAGARPRRQAGGEARRMGDRDRLAVRLREQRVGRRRERRASRAAGRADGAVHPDRRRRQSRQLRRAAAQHAGQVVGVNSQIYSRSGGYMGLSFAIPVDVAAKVADQLKAHGKVQHGRLGIGIQGLDQTLAQSFGLADANGALVGQVEKDSPAAKAGFKSGDVIRKIDGVAVIDSTDVTSRIGNTAPGTDAQRRSMARGQGVELSATIGTLDDAKIAKADDEARGEGQARRRRASADAGRAEGRRQGGTRRGEGGRCGGQGRRAAGRRDRRRGLRGSRPSTSCRSQVDKAGKTVALLIERAGPPDLRAGEAVLILRFGRSSGCRLVTAGRASFLRRRSQAATATFNASTRISSVSRALNAENSGVVFTV